MDSIDRIEDRLLILCARMRAGDAHKESVSNLVKCDVDWDYVVRVSVGNRIASPLYRNLLLLGDGAVPGKVIDKLRATHALTVALNLRINSELSRMLKALERNGIDCMLLKGAALERILGMNADARPKCDIDILIHEGEYAGVRDACLALGYSASPAPPDLDAREIVEYAHYFDQIKYFNTKGVKIDCHFRLINMGIPVDSEDIAWSRSTRIPMDGTDALVPSPEDMLMHLCFHANHHCFAKLYYFCDIDALIGHCNGAIDWDYFFEASGQRRISASMYYALLLTGRLFGTSIPGNVLDRLKPRYPKRVIFENIWLRGMSNRKRHLRFGSMEGPIYTVLEMDALNTKMKYVLKILFPPRKWLSHRYRRPESTALSFRYLFELLGRCRRSIELESK